MDLYITRELCIGNRIFKSMINRCKCHFSVYERCINAESTSNNVTVFVRAALMLSQLATMLHKSCESCIMQSQLSTMLQCL